MQTARVSQRFAGYLVDGVILSITGTSVYRLTGSESVWRWAPVVLGGIYTVGFITSSGSTIGKRLAGTQVVDEFERRPTLPGLRASFVRWLVLAWLVVLPGMVGGVVYLAMFVLTVGGICLDGRGRGIHDYLAGTRVIDVRHTERATLTR